MRQSTILEKIHEKVEYVWSLIRDACVRDARTVSEQLVRDVKDSLEETGEDNRLLLNAYAQACHAAGYAVSMSMRNRNALAALQYFQQMKKCAAALQDNTLLVIACSYKGDIYRRSGDLPKALSYLQAAYTHTPQNDEAALGNCAQLLGRVYFRLGDLKNFESVMEEAERIARAIDPVQNSLYGQYCLGTVFIDYAQFRSEQGQTGIALDYLRRAEEILPKTAHWQTLLTARRGILLVKSGDVRGGMPSVLHALQLCRNHGNERLLDHFYALEVFLSQKALEISEAKILLGDALNGSFEF